ncbi:MAG: acyltransferase [Gammaproteobacteria bacterium]|jgi:UDP-perosamine 4-acetyltransferase|nr:acyltransferase [Gammaproteobacteria bacterium]
MNKLIVLGAGGHAKVLLDLLEKLAQFDVIGLAECAPARFGQQLLNKTIFDESNILDKYPAGQYELVNGIGSIGPGEARQKIYEFYKSKHYRFPVISHPLAVVSKHAQLAEGVQIMAGVVIQAGTDVGENTVINSSASIDHDCKIGQHVHIAPGVVVSGGVEIGRGCHIGVGAVIIQGVKIGENSLIAAGSVVVKDVPAYSKVMGVPGRIVKNE